MIFLGELSTEFTADEMVTYRIAQSKYAKDITGTGAKLHGGRWNPKGAALLYTSEHKSLAALEVLVHFEREFVPDDLQIITIEVPDKEIKNFSQKLFEEITIGKNTMLRFQEEGLKWIKSNESLAIRVPSILIPGEFNVLINPEHPKFDSKISVLNIESFKFDERFFE